METLSGLDVSPQSQEPLCRAYDYTNYIYGNGVVCVHAKSLQLCLTPGSSVHGILQDRIVEWLSCPPPGDLPDSGIEFASLMSPPLQAGSLPTKPPGKP